MVRLDADATGKIVRMVFGVDFGMAAHPATASQLTFDDGSNAALFTDLLLSTDPYTYLASVLKKGAVAQTVQPDSTPVADRKALLNGAANAIATNNTFIALAAPTAAQVAAQTKALSQQANQIIKRLIQITQV